MLEEEEKELIEELRSQCYRNGTEKNPLESAKIFHKLGLVYQKRSEMLNLIKSAALLNAAIIREPINVSEIKEDLRKLCSEILQNAGVDIDADGISEQSLIEKANSVKKQLEEIRARVKDALAKVQAPNKNDAINDLKKHELEKVEFIKTIQDRITSDYTFIMKNLSSFCERLMGNAPCKFAHIGMGSLARREITPFSDFENLIVLEEGCQSFHNYGKITNYFRWFAVIFQVVLINLGETILPSVNITSLNDTLKEGGDWFYDAYTPQGVSFDGMMAHACKSPLGRQQSTFKKPWTTELIKPVREMLKYLNSEEAFQNGYHLGDILTKTCFVFGDESVKQEFENGVEETLKSKATNVLQQEISEQIKHDINNYGVKVSLSNYADKDAFNFKRVVYRSTTLFLSALGRLHRIKGNSSFSIISELEEKKLISGFVSDKLLLAVALACEMRLRIYLKKNKQDDWIKTESTSSADVSALVKTMGQRNCVNYFQIAYLLQCYVCQQLKIKNWHFYSHLNFLNVSIYNFLNLRRIALKLLSSFKADSVKEPDIIDFDSSLKRLEKETEMLNENVSSSQNILNSQMKSDHFLQICESLFCLESYDEAFDYGKQYLASIDNLLTEDQTIRDKARVLYILGKCSIKMKRLYQAIHYFQLSLDLEKTRNESFDSIESVILHELGVCYGKNKMLDKAIDYLIKSLHMKELASFNVERDKSLATSLHALGDLLMKKKQYNDAYTYLQKSLSIKQSISQDETVDKDVAVTLYKIGRCHLDLEELEDAYNLLQNSLHIAEKASTDKNTDNGIAIISNSLGKLYQKLNKPADAKFYFSKYSTIKKQLSLSSSDI